MDPAPNIVHMMHFPWDRQHRLLDDPEAFDHAPVEAMRAYARGFDVKFWSYPLASALCRERYPEVWSALARAARPVMLVDVLRWVVVHRFGGIYSQINSCPLVPMEQFLPDPARRVRLFTEFDQTPEHCEAMRVEPIRAGLPEERKRVLIQVFSAAPGATFVKKTIDFMTDRLRTCEVKRDYDVLYVNRNAAASTAFDRYGKDDPEVEIVDLARSKAMIKWHYRGTWRTDTHTVSATPSPAPRPARALPRAAASLVYRFGKRHPHDEMLAGLGNRTGCWPALASLVHGQLRTSMVEFPCGRVEVDRVPDGVRYVGGDSVSGLVEEIRRGCRTPNARFVSMNLFHSILPRADLFASADYLERVSFREIARLLQRILKRGFRLIALSHHPLLTENWDTALGDHRPLNFTKPPFSFPPPLASVPWPKEQVRVDRSLAV